jgi:hypothetical protein
MARGGTVKRTARAFELRPIAVSYCTDRLPFIFT